jgi:hypothetical protein
MGDVAQSFSITINELKELYHDYHSEEKAMISFWCSIIHFVFSSRKIVFDYLRIQRYILMNKHFLFGIIRSVFLYD